MSSGVGLSIETVPTRPGSSVGSSPWGAAADGEVEAGEGGVGGQDAGDLGEHRRPGEVGGHGLGAEVGELGLGRKRLAHLRERGDLGEQLVGLCLLGGEPLVGQELEPERRRDDEQRDDDRAEDDPDPAADELVALAARDLGRGMRLTRGNARERRVRCAVISVHLPECDADGADEVEADVADRRRA